MPRTAQTPTDTPNSLQEIITYCRKIQQECHHMEEARRSIRSREPALVDFCRRCTDHTCPNTCEVKKTFIIMR